MEFSQLKEHNLRGRPKMMRSVVVNKGEAWCCKEDALDRTKWKLLICQHTAPTHGLSESMFIIWLSGTKIYLDTCKEMVIALRYCRWRWWEVLRAADLVIWMPLLVEFSWCVLI